MVEAEALNRVLQAKISPPFFTQAYLVRELGLLTVLQRVSQPYELDETTGCPSVRVAGDACRAAWARHLADLEDGRGALSTAEFDAAEEGLGGALRRVPAVVFADDGVAARREDEEVGKHPSCSPK